MHMYACIHLTPKRQHNTCALQQRRVAAPAGVPEADHRLLALEVPHHCGAVAAGRRQDVLHLPVPGHACDLVAALHSCGCRGGALRQGRSVRKAEGTLTLAMAIVTCTPLGSYASKRKASNTLGLQDICLLC